MTKVGLGVDSVLPVVNDWIRLMDPTSMSKSDSTDSSTPEASVWRSGDGEAIAAIAFIAESLAANQARCYELTLGAWAATLEAKGFDPGSLVSLFDQIVERIAAEDPKAAQVRASLRAESSTLAALRDIRQLSPRLLEALFAHLELGLDLGDELSVASGGVSYWFNDLARMEMENTHLSKKAKVEIDFSAYLAKDAIVYKEAGQERAKDDIDHQLYWSRVEINLRETNWETNPNALWNGEEQERIDEVEAFNAKAEADLAYAKDRVSSNPRESFRAVRDLLLAEVAEHGLDQAAREVDELVQDVDEHAKELRGVYDVEKAYVEHPRQETNAWERADQVVEFDESIAKKVD